MPENRIPQNEPKVKNIKEKLGENDNRLFAVIRALAECADLLEQVRRQLAELAEEGK